MTVQTTLVPKEPAETARHRRLVRFLAGPIVAIAIGLVAAWIVPHVLGEEFLVRQIARAYAPIVGSWHGNERQDDVSVMLLDDTSLQSAGQAWPADYGYYARLLDALAASRPRAVFFDIAFAAQREDPSLDRLQAAVCRAGSAGVKVYLAARRDAAGRFLLRPELDALAGRCLTKVAIEYDPDASDQTAWTYRLAADTQAGEGRVMNVASAIYRDLGHALPAHQHSDLAVNWGLRPAARGIDWLEAPDAGDHVAHSEAGPEAGAHAAAAPGAGHESDEEAVPYCRQPGNVYYELLVPSVYRHWRDPASQRPICVYHNTLYPSDLQTSSAEDEALLARHVTGRVVMIGTALQGSNDRVLSPLHGRIPGVYMHAMALENLLVDGDGYNRASHVDLVWEGGRVLWMLLAGLVLIAFGHRQTQRAKKAAQERWTFSGLSHALRKLGQAGVWLLLKLGGLLLYSVFFLVMLAIGQWLDVGFLTVIHVALYSFAAEWLEWNESLLKWWTDEKAGHEAPGEAAAA